MNLRERLNLRFIGRVITSAEGRAHLLNQCADAEGNGENGFFEHILAHVDDPSLQQDDHQAPRRRAPPRAAVPRRRATRPASIRGPVPDELKLIDRLDRAVGGFFSQPIRDRRDIMQAYLMLQVIEERALTQFALFELAFRDVDPRDRRRHRRDRARRRAPPQVLPRHRAPLRARRAHADARRCASCASSRRARSPRTAAPTCSTCSTAAASRSIPSRNCSGKRSTGFLPAAEPPLTRFAYAEVA